MLLLHGICHLFGKLVLDPACADFRDLVMRVRAPDLVGPLHLLRLDDQPPDLGLAVLGRCERHNEVGPLPTSHSDTR